MKYWESCSCGASFKVNYHIEKVIREFLLDWRENHRCSENFEKQDTKISIGFHCSDSGEDEE